MIDDKKSLVRYNLIAIGQTDCNTQRKEPSDVQKVTVFDMKTRRIIISLVLTALLSIGTAGFASASTCSTLSCRLRSILSSYTTGTRTFVSAPSSVSRNDSQTQSQTAQNITLQNSASSLQSQLLALLNKERSASGVGKLSLSSELSAVAQAKAEDMAKNGYFSHTSPVYGTPFEMMKSYGIRYRYAAENLAKNSSVEKAHYALMNSDGHRKNILNGNYTQVGIGIVKVSSNSYIIVEMFIG